jgi:hypothetical protein
MAALMAGLAAGFAVVTAAALAIGGLTSVRPALSAGDYVAIATPWRWLRSVIQLVAGEGIADTIVKIWAVVAVLTLAWLLLRRLPGPERLAPPAGLDGSSAAIGSSEANGLAGVARLAWADGDGTRAAGLAARAVLAFALAWLTAGTYVLPWYDGLAWAVLPLLPWSMIDWFVLARTAALAVGYLPARSIAMPSGLRWLETVVRTGVTPALLLIIAIMLVVTLRSVQQPIQAPSS